MKHILSNKTLMGKRQNVVCRSETFYHFHTKLTWEIKLLEITAKSLELPLLLLNMSLTYCGVFPELHMN